MKTLFLPLFSVLVVYVNAQNLVQFNERQQKINGIGMSILGSWAIGNVAWGIAGLQHSNDQFSNFSQMNISWGAINLGLALPGYLRSKKVFTQLMTARKPILNKLN
jgi:hypothetical protein